MEVLTGEIVCALIIIIALNVFLGGSINLHKRGTYIKIYFKNLAYLKPGAAILLGGYKEIGEVRHILLESDRAIVTAEIYPGEKIYISQRFQILTKGLLGDYMIICELPSSSNPAEWGRRIREGDVFRGADPITDVALIDRFPKSPEMLYLEVQNFGNEINRLSVDFQTYYSNVEPMINEINAYIGVIDYRLKIAAPKSTIDNISENFRVVSDDITDISSAIKERRGSLGKIIHSKELKNKINSIIAIIKEIEKK